MGVGRQKVGSAHITIGEVATSTSRNANLLGHFGRVVEQHNTSPELPGHGGTVQPSGASADNNRIKESHAEGAAKRREEWALDYLGRQSSSSGS